MDLILLKIVAIVNINNVPPTAVFGRVSMVPELKSTALASPFAALGAMGRNALEAVNGAPATASRIEATSKPVAPYGSNWKYRRFPPA